MTDVSVCLDLDCGVGIFGVLLNLVDGFAPQFKKHSEVGLVYWQIVNSQFCMLGMNFKCKECPNSVLDGSLGTKFLGRKYRNLMHNLHTLK